MLLSLFISFRTQHSDRDTGAAEKLSASVPLSLLCFPASLPESLPESLTVCQCSCRDSGISVFWQAAATLRQDRSSRQRLSQEH